MGWSINERTLSPTYSDDPVDYWYPDLRNPDSNFEQCNFPQLGKVTAELLEALDECYEMYVIDESVGPLPEGSLGRSVRSAMVSVLREYGLTIDTYMSELNRRVSPGWLYRHDLWDLDDITQK